MKNKEKWDGELNHALICFCPVQRLKKTLEQFSSPSDFWLFFVIQLLSVIL